MSEKEENESIEIMKDYIQDFTCDGGKYPYLVDSMKLIIRLVEKQQKEIEELKKDISNMYDKQVVRNILKDECGLSKYEIDELLEED